MDILTIIAIILTPFGVWAAVDWIYGDEENEPDY